MFLSVIIAAGGAGTRMKLGGSKQLLELGDRPVLAHTVSLFNHHEAVREIIIAIDAANAERCSVDVVEKYKFDKVVAVVPGGDIRPASVFNALKKVGAAADTILVHDGARPLFPAALLDRGLKELRDERLDGVVFGVPATDTVKEADVSRVVQSTLDRERIWLAQTPQIFRRVALERAYRAPNSVLARATDDAILVEQSGGRLKMSMGSYENIKLTTPTDMLIAKKILESR